MSSKDRSGTPPEMFAARCRSVSQMEDRDKDGEEAVKRAVERSNSKLKKSERGSTEELKKGRTLDIGTDAKLSRSSSCRVPGSIRKAK
ncbi:hypothetical protein HDU98_008728 [Podochytrium sp. JEL0797]|nr:hypothetical protein HDU98_008728 [Podochytrium sp. JEL0797]